MSEQEDPDYDYIDDYQYRIYKLAKIHYDLGEYV